MSRPTICDVLCRRLFSQQAQSFIQNVLGGVNVPVVMSAANRAHPFAHGKVFRSSPLLTAGRAQLAGWIEPVHSDNRFAVPVCFVLQLPTELTPRCVADGFRQLMVFTILLGAKSSMQMTSFSRTSAVDSLCSISSRWLAMCSCIRATASRALSRRLLPFAFGTASAAALRAWLRS